MLIPVLHTEGSVQIQDLTRFNAAKSVSTRGSGDISSVKLKAGIGEDEVEVFDPNPEEWFLDWVYTSQKFDVTTGADFAGVRALNAEYAIKLDHGSYSLEGLLNHIKAKLEASVSGLTFNYVVDFEKRVSIQTSTPISLNLKDPSTIWTRLNFYDSDKMTSLPVEYGLRLVTLTVSDGTTSKSVTSLIKVFTPEGDRLFSADSDLVDKEKDLLKWTSEGRVSFIADHRAAQNEILDFLQRNGFTDIDGKALTKWSISNTKELRLWSTYLTLSNLFRDFSNASDDVFRDKAKDYHKSMIEARNMYTLTLDTDNDGEPDAVQETGTWEGRVIYR